MRETYKIQLCWWEVAKERVDEIAEFCHLMSASTAATPEGLFIYGFGDKFDADMLECRLRDLFPPL